MLAVVVLLQDDRRRRQRQTQALTLKAQDLSEGMSKSISSRRSFDEGSLSKYSASRVSMTVIADLLPGRARLAHEEHRRA